MNTISFSTDARRLVRALTLAFCCMLLGAPAAWARQHLVAPGSDWERLDAQIKPGDEILLMPGRHVPARLWNVQGTAAQPIIIRGLDADHVATIVAKRHGVRLHRPRHVLVQDVEIVGASVSGLLLDDTSRPGSPNAAVDAEPPGHVTVRRVIVRKIGPVGRRNAIEVVGLKNVQVLECKVEGWGGTAIELVGCRSVRVESCTLRGLDDHSQLDGVRARAGSDIVEITRCRFERVTGQCLSLGAESKPEEFRPPLTEDTEPGSRYEIVRAIVRQCVMIESGIALTMRAGDSCTLRGNTVVRPRGCVIALADRADEPRIGATRGILFGENLITWKPGDLKRLAVVDGDVDPTVFTLEENLWWSVEPAEERAKLGDPPGQLAYPQLVDVDPKLNESFNPTAAGARMFGAQIPDSTATAAANDSD